MCLKPTWKSDIIFFYQHKVMSLLLPSSGIVERNVIKSTSRSYIVVILNVVSLKSVLLIIIVRMIS